MPNRRLILRFVFCGVIALLLPVPPGSAGSSDPLGWEVLPVPGSGGRLSTIRPSPHEADRVIVNGDMLGVGISTDGGHTWQTAGFGLKSYEIGDATWHPSDPETVWIGTMSGPAVSSDGGVHFEYRRNGMPPIEEHNFSSPIERVLFDPNDDTRLLAIGGSSRRWRGERNPHPKFGRVWESTDAGQTWELLCTFTPDGSVAEDLTDDVERRMNIVAATFLADSSDVLLAAAYHSRKPHGAGVFKSTDGGRTWRPSSSGLSHLTVRRVIAHPTDPSVAWVSLGSDASEDGPAQPGGVWRTRDAGATWEPINDGLTRKADENPMQASRYRAFDVSPHDPDRMVVWDASWSVGVCYVSDDGGENWRPAATRKQLIDEGEIGLTDEQVRLIDGHSVFNYGDQTPYATGFGHEHAAYSPAEPGVIYAVGAAYASKSTDGGETWNEVMSEPAGESDYGQLWRGTGFNGLVARNVAFDPATPALFAVQGMDSARVWLTADGGETWSYHGKDPEMWSGGSDLAFAGDAKHVYASFGQHNFSGFARSLDNGRTWDVLHGPERGLPAKGASHRPWGIAVDPREPKRAFGAHGDKLYRTDDAGDTWRVVHEAMGLRAVEDDPTQPGTLLLRTDAGVVRFGIDDGSATRLGGPVGDDIAVASDGTIYATQWRDGDAAGAWRLASDAAEWVCIFADDYAGEVAVDPKDPRRIAVGTSDRPWHDHMWSSGVYLSDDGGETFAQANQGLPMRRISAIAFDPHSSRIVLGTGGRGFFHANWADAHALAGAESRGDDRRLPLAARP